MKQDLTNQFFDINKLPKEKGLLVFGLSMNKLNHGGQTANDCIDYVRNFTPSKVSKPLIGANFIYSDFLYLYSDKPAPLLKNSFMNTIIQHKNSLQKIIEKNNLEFQIQNAFNYLTWSQLYVGSKDFNEKFLEIQKIYSLDKKFQKHITADCKLYAREMHENQINFFLEEITMFYLMLKNQVKLPNDFIENQQEWILFCYPGKPLKSTVYLFQLNPFDLDWPENPYQNSVYDLESKKLYDFDRLDLETWDYE
jgi:hypothetical protein